MSKVVKRSIKINFIDETFKDLDLTKVQTVKTNKQFIYLDYTDSGWKLVLSENLIDNISKVKNVEIIREN